MGRLTDNQLAKLMVHLNADYRDLVAKKFSPHDIYQQLLNKVNYSLSNPYSSLFNLSQDDQFLIYNALNTFFEACPQYIDVNPEQRQNLFNFNHINLSNNQLPNYLGHGYCSANEVLFTWVILDTLTHTGTNSWFTCFGSDDKLKGEPWAILLLIILAALALGAALVAMAYLFLDFFDNMERFWHNEGWMQAAISMLATAASGFAVAFLTTYFLTAPLIALGITAGLSNPIGLAIVGIVCLSIIGAGLGAFVANQVQDYLNKKNYPDAMDPQDPHRFVLTESETQHLQFLGYDPLKVKCAMIAIREQIGDTKIPSFLRRSDEKQELLNKIRQLRKGEVENGIMEVQSGEHLLRFNLRPFQYAIYVQQPVYQQQYDYSQEAIKAQQYGNVNVQQYESNQFLQPSSMEFPSLSFQNI